MKEKLEGLLCESTTSAELDALNARLQTTNASLQWSDKRKSAYLKLKQKRTNQDEWLLNPATKETHSGAHFPLFLVTDNACRRSAQAIEKRKGQYLQTHNGSAVAARPSWKMSQADRETPARLLRCPVPDQARQAAPATPDRAAPDQAAQAAQSVAARWDGRRRGR